MPITSEAIAMMVNIISNGITNLNHVFKLILTMANEGRIRPVGARKDMMAIPYKYEFTISLPGTFTKMANAPMIGIVNTAIPEEDCIKMEKTI